MSYRGNFLGCLLVDIFGCSGGALTDQQVYCSPFAASIGKMKCCVSVHTPRPECQRLYGPGPLSSLLHLRPWV